MSAVKEKCVKKSSMPPVWNAEIINISKLLTSQNVCLSL